MTISNAKCFKIKALFKALNYISGKSLMVIWFLERFQVPFQAVFVRI